jgi:hypothetical protein
MVGFGTLSRTAISETVSGLEAETIVSNTEKALEAGPPPEASLPRAGLVDRLTFRAFAGAGWSSASSERAMQFIRN